MPARRPPAGFTVGNNAFQNAAPEDAAAILGSLTTRSSDIDFWPNIDYLATKSPTSQKIIVNVDLNNDNVWLMDKATATVFGALGVCGIIPCPGHNAGHFAFSHMTAVDFERQHLPCRNDHRPPHPEVRAGEIGYSYRH